MTQKEFINLIAESAGISQKQATGIVKLYAHITGEWLSKTGEVTLPSIGKLTVIARPARDGRNPRTGEKMTIPAGKKVGFKAAKELKDAV